MSGADLKRLAVFGGSFNPPGLHHIATARRLAERFDEVIIVPCGPRPDKQTTNDVPAIDRAAMADMTFGGLAKTRVDLFDLEAAEFTPTHLLDERYRDHGEVWHVVSAEMIAGGAAGESLMQRQWQEAERIWRELRFAVVKQPDADLDDADLPPNNEMVPIDEAGNSTQIRDAIFQRRDYDGLVRPRVARYIERRSLYRGTRPPTTAGLKVTDARPFLVADPRNKKGSGIIEELRSQRPFVDDPKDADLIVVVGGDGTMLHAIREHWRARLPFYGINIGHLGFLLNGDPPPWDDSERLLVEQVGLLWVSTETAGGRVDESLAFNDAWVERATGQTAWLRIDVDGSERVPRLIADGALLSTAAGSTAYARAMGAPALPLNTPALVLVGSNVLQPAGFRPAVLPLPSTVELTTLDPDKRPLLGYVDGIPQGKVTRMVARQSNIAAVELAFGPRHHPARKLARIQFPMA